MPCYSRMFPSVFQTAIIRVRARRLFRRTRRGGNGTFELTGAVTQEMFGRMKYRITLIEDEDGGWAVRCDDLPGCFSQGETREEAIENIRIAIREFTDYLRDEGRLAEYLQENARHEEVFV